MPNLANRSFAAGELAPALYARTDLAKYEAGLRQCRNFIVMRQGGAAKRPGTIFLNEVKDSTKRVRLLPFIFNVADTMVLEFGEHYIRFYQRGGLIEDPSNLPNAYEVVTPYLETDLLDLKFVQSGDVVTLVHPSYPPKELKRFGDANWTLTDILFSPSIAAPTGLMLSGGAPGPVVPTHLSDYVVTALTAAGEESLNSGQNFLPVTATSTAPVSLTWTASVGAVSYKVYKLLPDLFNVGGTHGGVYAYLGETTNTNYGDDGGTIPDITLQPPIPFTGLQAINDYPSVVTYYQQRLVFAASNNNPDTIWCSRTGFFHNFTTSAIVQDDDAIQFRLVSDEVDPIEHIENVGRMVVGSQGAEWIVEGDGNGVITPSAVNSRIGSRDGVAGLRPIKAGNFLIFLQALASQVRQLQANVQFGYYSLQSTDLTVYSSHLVEGFGIVDWCWQQVFPHVAWAVRSDGSLLGLTFVPEQEVMAWHRHDTQGFVESVCCVPEGNEHFVYWAARRLIPGSNPPTTTAYHRYIERMTSTIQFPVVANQPVATGLGGVPGGNPGGTPTPPPPPPPPPPAQQPIAAPSNPSTTDIGTTTATANWTAGNLSAGSTIELRILPFTTWGSPVTLPAGQQSYTFTGLTPHAGYEWRVQHFIGSTTSPWLEPPTIGVQFTTAIPTTPHLSDPDATRILIAQFGTGSSGSQPTEVGWGPSPQGGSANVQIAGPTDISPTDGEYTQVGAGNFDVSVQGALWTVTSTGNYWIRVRYELQDFIASNWVVSSTAPTMITVP